MTRTPDFKEKVRQWAEKISVEPSRIQVQEMKNKWASCSTGGRLCFSRDLLKKEEAFQESVIVHELVHLLVPNHGPLFRQLVTAFRPEAGDVGRCSSGRNIETGRFISHTR